MTNRKKLFLNSFCGVIKQLVAVACGFILPRYFLDFYGSEVNGLVSSITTFLAFISFMEMGVGPVIQSNLYKPLSDNDDLQVSRIVKSSQRFYHRLAFIFLGYIAVLFFVYPLFINSSFDFLFTGSLVLILAISICAEYFIGATYQVLLNADQKSYIHLLMQIGAIIINTIVCIVLMKIGCSIQIVKLVSASIFVIRPLGQILYVKKHYHIDKKIVLEDEPIKQKWNGLSQHIAGVVCTNVDIVLLTLFSSLASVSVYSVYYSIVIGVTNIIIMSATGIDAYFGNLIAKNDNSQLNRSFAIIEFLVHALITVIFTTTAITIVPFVTVYTNGIDDANYIQPIFGLLLVIAYACQCLRIPYYRVIKGAGHFKQTQNGAFVSAGLNVIISLVLVFFLNLIGLAIGTLVAMLFHTVYFVVYLRKNIVNRPVYLFLYQLLVDVAVFVSAFFACSLIKMSSTSYFAWIIYALEVFGIVFVLLIAFNLLFNFKKCQSIILLIKERISYKSNNKKTEMLVCENGVSNVLAEETNAQKNTSNYESENEKKKELANVTFVKTVLMVLIVIYHSFMFYSGDSWFDAVTPYESSIFIHYGTSWLNSFHIYAFVLASGYLFSFLKIENGNYQKFWPFVLNKTKRLLIPFIFSLCICVIPVALFFYNYGIFDILFKFLLGTSPNQLWFLLMLFFVFVFAWPLSNLFNKHPFLSLLICVGFYLMGIVGAHFLPNVLQIWTSCKYLLFFFIGFALRRNAFPWLKKIPFWIYIFLDIIVFVGLCFLQNKDGFVWSAFSLCTSTALNVVGALMAWTTLQFLATHIRWQNNKFLNFLSERSMAVYLFHQQIIYFSIFLLNGHINIYLNAGINFIISFGLSLLFATILLLWNPTRILVGEKTRPKRSSDYSKNNT